MLNTCIEIIKLLNAQCSDTAVPFNLSSVSSFPDYKIEHWSLQIKVIHRLLQIVYRLVLYIESYID